VPTPLKPFGFDLTKRCPSGSGARRFARELGFGENHWEALPRLADLFDSQTPQPFFKGSKVSELERVKRVLKAASNDPYAVAQMLGRRIGTDFGNLVIPLPGTSEVLSYAFTCPCQLFSESSFTFESDSLASRRHACDSQGLRLGAFTELIPSSETLRRMNGNTVLGNSGQSTGRDRAVGSCGRQHCSQCLAADAADGARPTLRCQRRQSVRRSLPFPQTFRTKSLSLCLSSKVLVPTWR
jgi:hypothetical protein